MDTEKSKKVFSKHELERPVNPIQKTAINIIVDNRILEPEMKKTLRLLLTSECNRDCAGCCNKDWDLEKLPIETSFEGYDEIILTGGEPMLEPGRIIKVSKKIKKVNKKAKIYLYTADTSRNINLNGIMFYIDGITITLHNQTDVTPCRKFLMCLPKTFIFHKSIRINVFKGVDISAIGHYGTIIKENYEWIKDCPLPEHEVFKRYN